MRINIPKDSRAGSQEIPKGDYWVSLHSDSQQIFLSAGGRDIKLPAVRRRNKARSKSTSVTFYSAGGVHWSLLISTPKYGEWIALIELGISKERERVRRRA